jgi:hypothetical protein
MSMNPGARLGSSGMVDDDHTDTDDYPVPHTPGPSNGHTRTQSFGDHAEHVQDVKKESSRPTSSYAVLDLDT